MTIRLTQAHRDAIESRLLNHRFKKEEEALAEKKRSVESNIYWDVYPDGVRQAMQALPPGFLPNDESLRVHFPGRDVEIETYGRLTGYRHNWSVQKSYKADDNLVEEYEYVERCEKDLIKLKRIARQQIRATLKQFRSDKAFQRDWPEAYAIASTAIGIPDQLPTVQLGKLNEVLHLPEVKEKKDAV